MSLAQTTSPWTCSDEAIGSGRAGVHTDSYRLARAFLVIMSITVIDVFNVLDRGFAAFRPGAQPGVRSATSSCSSPSRPRCGSDCSSRRS